MACPAIVTGNHFLWRTLEHVDCQAQAIGSYGYGALADPASTVSIALSGVLTLFVALLGVRMLLGYAVDGRDVVGSAIKIGIVLLLATSWPAWRVIGYDMVFKAPSEIARMIGNSSGLPEDDDRLRMRLQYVDDGLVAMTIWGTGRMTEPVAGNFDPNRAFRGIALSDETGFGWGRVLFLAGAIGPYAIIRLSAGILLAVAPLMAGLLLFGGTVGLFVGWVRALVFCMLGGLALFLIQSVQLAIFIPWVSDVVAQRDAGGLTPSAPTELIVLTLAFCALSFFALFLMARLAFQSHPILGWMAGHSSQAVLRDRTAAATAPSDNGAGFIQPSRAYIIGEAVSATLRREEREAEAAGATRSVQIDVGRTMIDQRLQMAETRSDDMLGSSYRRTRRRTSAVSERRDRRA